VQRVTKFIKYLKDFGWTPIVLAPDNPEYQARDESLAKELPSDLIVHHSHISNRMTFTGNSPALKKDYR